MSSLVIYIEDNGGADITELFSLKVCLVSEESQFYIFVVFLPRIIQPRCLDHLLIWSMLLLFMRKRSKRSSSQLKMIEVP